MILENYPSAASLQQSLPLPTSRFTTEQALKKEVEFVYVPTEFQVADCLTKSVPREKLEYCRRKMGVEGISKPKPKFQVHRRNHEESDEEDFC